MSLLIHDILNYAMTGSKGLTAENINLNKLVADKIIDLNHLIKSKSATVNLDLPTKLINCFPHLIGLVFYNLINNAIKFNVSATPLVNCTYIENEDDWIFSIEDNGIGIDPKYAKKIFEPFRRLVGGNYEGSGMGLSICKRVVMLHKGNIWIEESEHMNTLIKFSISKQLSETLKA